MTTRSLRPTRTLKTARARLTAVGMTSEGKELPIHISENSGVLLKDPSGTAEALGFQNVCGS